MADNLQSISIASPGFFGLNTQESGVDLGVGYAIEAQNCIIDAFGRIGSRKGWLAMNSSTGNLGANDITATVEFIKTDGSKEILLTGNKRIFRLDGSTLTQLYYDATLTGDKWQIAQLKGKCYFFQEGEDPLVYDGTSIVKITASTGYVGTVPKAGIVSAAYGRLWVGLGSTVYWSDLLTGNNWGTGTSGFLDLTTVFPKGQDEVTGVVAHNGFLIILCRKCVIIYSNAKDPANLSLSDLLPNVGCIAKNSIQTTGADLIFLSDRGVVSLGTLIQEKSLPQNDMSKNVRDQLLASLDGIDLDTIKSVYYERDAFYLLSIPLFRQVYCFDMRSRLDSGASRTTIWQGILPISFTTTKNRELLIGFNGYLGKYTGYTDNGNAYRMTYYTNHMNPLGAGDTSLKLLKKIKYTIIGGSTSGFVSKWAFDYSTNFHSTSVKIPLTSGAEYNVSEYAIGQYTGGTNIASVIKSVGGSGIVVQLGIEADVNGSPLSIQKVDLYYKSGKKL